MEQTQIKNEQKTGKCVLAFLHHLASWIQSDSWILIGASARRWQAALSLLREMQRAPGADSCRLQSCKWAASGFRGLRKGVQLDAACFGVVVRILLQSWSSRMNSCITNMKPQHKYRAGFSCSRKVQQKLWHSPLQAGSCERCGHHGLSSELLVPSMVSQPNYFFSSDEERQTGCVDFSSMKAAKPKGHLFNWLDLAHTHTRRFTLWPCCKQKTNVCSFQKMLEGVGRKKSRQAEMTAAAPVGDKTVAIGQGLRQRNLEKPWHFELRATLDISRSTGPGLPRSWIW